MNDSETSSDFDSGDEHYHLACDDQSVAFAGGDRQQTSKLANTHLNNADSEAEGIAVTSCACAPGAVSSSSSTLSERLVEGINEVTLEQGAVAADNQDAESVKPALTEEEKETHRVSALALKDRGNECFRRKDYKDAAQLYAEAAALCPLSFTGERAIVLANRAACYAHLDRHEEAIEDCGEALRLNPSYTKARLRRAELYEKKEKYEEALEDFKVVLEADSEAQPAREAIQRLPVLINKRNEELKTEMLGKLKDLGNMVLKPFGLSTENFKVAQDPSTGSYSINFQQKQ